MTLNFFSNPPSSAMSAMLPFLGALIGAFIAAWISYIVSKRSQRTSLYEAVFKQKFDVAVKITTEAEYLRRGLAEYQQESPEEKVDFKRRWLNTARELEFHARLFRWVLDEKVEKAALALAEECKKSMEAQRSVPDADVERKYIALGNAVHDQTYLPELDKIFKTYQRR